jgi:hypothetical protein
MMQRVAKDVRRTLCKRAPSEQEFSVALDSCCLFEPRRWKKSVERCYERFPEKSRMRLRPDMFNFYYGFSNFRKAGEFVSHNPRKLACVPNEMAVHFELGHESEAKELADWCQARLNPNVQSWTQTMLRLALAVYHANLGDLENAERHLLQVDNGDYVATDWCAAFLVDIQMAILMKKAWLQLKKVRTSGSISSCRIKRIMMLLERALPPQLRETGGI